MAFDAQRDRTFLFGGVTNGSPAWEWDGRNWSFVSAPGPVARHSHAMAYDSLRNCIVMFGGFDPAGPQRLADTWEWNGSSWSMRAYQSVAPLSDHALAFDPQRGRTVLFGGYCGFEFGETWEWDGSSWLQRSTTGPQARHAHCMTFHANQAHVILFGGIQGANTIGDTWSWNGSQWAQLASTGPTPRYAHAMAFDSLRNRTVLFGGATTAPPASLGDTWEWNGTAWTPAAISASAPTARSEHAMCWHPSSGAMVLFGGTSTTDTWLYGTEATATGTAYGSACGAPRPQLTQANGQLPLLGSSARVSLQPLLGPVTFLALGSSASSFGASPLPWSLAAYGMPGCFLHQSADISTALPMLPTVLGTAEFALSIPALPFLLGVHIYLQAWVPVAGANAAGIVTSNGIDWLLGNR
jgi:hypothetical protein